MALILYRVMRMRLKAANTQTSPERALEILRRIQHHRIRLNARDPMTGLSSIMPEQTDLFKALNVRKPIATRFGTVCGGAFLARTTTYQ